MHILICNHTSIPVFAYGGTERVIWDLGLTLAESGHQVTYLVPQGSHCPFANVLVLDRSQSLASQIPKDVDLVHFQFHPGNDLDIDQPWLMTQHGNSVIDEYLPRNTVFVSRSHAWRHGSECFVYNGLDWRAYGQANLDASRTHHHFLGKAMWRVKNVQGAIDVCLKAKAPLTVMGGTRLNIKRGFRWTWSRSIQFAGMVGGEEKFNIMRQSKGLVFPVRWHEPFGLAVIESLYFGCPVYATPYGALPEIVTEAEGVLSNSADRLAQAILQDTFDRRACHLRAVQEFNAQRMASDYLRIYERLLDGESLNPTFPMMREVHVPLPWHR